MNMAKNMGNTDRMIRVIAGALIAAWGISAANWLGLIGAALLATAYLQWCPAYDALGKNTLEK